MRFEQRLVATARDIEARLAAVLGDKIGDTIDSTGDCVPPRLAAAMHHAVMAGGKRIRPFLVLESAAMFGIDTRTAMPAALALELVHCYSLVHDDLPAMDNDVLRRGQPTVWKAFDDWTAILAGDALLTLAFEVLAVPGNSVPAETKATLVVELARASGRAGMVGGQCLDLEADKLGQPAAPTRQHIQQLQAMKTGALFRFACHAGALLGGGTSSEEQSLRRFGDKLGAAFQLADDLLDAEGEAATVGKATGKDAAAGKATLIGLLGLDQARIRLAEIEASAREEIRSFGSRADVLRAALGFAIQRRS